MPIRLALLTWSSTKRFYSTFIYTGFSTIYGPIFLKMGKAHFICPKYFRLINQFFFKVWTKGVKIQTFIWNKKVVGEVKFWLFCHTKNIWLIMIIIQFCTISADLIYLCKCKINRGESGHISWIESTDRTTNIFRLSIYSI